MDTSPKPSRRGPGRPSKESVGFARFRDEITRLWFIEKKSLNEVIKTMKVTYNFSATPKQYKKRLKDWKLRKNIRTCDMLQLARYKIECEAIGRPPGLLMNGEEIDCIKVDRFIRRKREELGPNRFNILFACSSTSSFHGDPSRQGFHQNNKAISMDSAIPPTSSYAAAENTSVPPSDVPPSFQATAVHEICSRFFTFIKVNGTCIFSSSNAQELTSLRDSSVTISVNVVKGAFSAAKLLQAIANCLTEFLATDFCVDFPVYVSTTGKAGGRGLEPWSVFLGECNPRQHPPLGSRSIRKLGPLDTLVELKGLQSRFMYHLQKLKRASEVSVTNFQSICGLFSSEEHALLGAILTLSMLWRLMHPGDLSRIIPFLCLVRAISEVLDGGSYLEVFPSGLMSWTEIFHTFREKLAFREAVKSLWDIDLDFLSDSPSVEVQQNLLNLREIAAGFLLQNNADRFSKSRSVENEPPDRSKMLINRTPYNMLGGHISPTHSQAAISVYPPDKQVCPNIAAFVQTAMNDWNIDSSVIQIVTGPEFAICFAFLQTHHSGDATLSLTTQGMGIPFIPSGVSQANKDTLNPCFDYSGVSPMLLSRPATPTIEQWYPNFENCSNGIEW